MPLYEYTCTNSDCNEDAFEKIVSKDDRDEVSCPVCDTTGERTFGSNYTIKYGTDGFYQTDYNDKSYQ